MIQSPLTLLGWITLGASTFLLGYSQFVEIPLGIYSGFIGMVLPLVSGATAFLLRHSLDPGRIRWEYPVSITAGRTLPLVCVIPRRGPLFFRLKVVLSGGLKLQEQRISLLRTQWVMGGTRGQTGIVSPWTGPLKLKARYYWTDLLGLGQYPLPETRDLDIMILPEEIERDIFKVDHLSENSESQKSRRRDELEKVFTREYMPGDLVRDINWKAYAKLGQLITRIPPEALGESTKLQVYYRPPQDEYHYLSLVHLEWSKRLLWAFLLEQRRRDPKVAFELYLGRSKLSLTHEEPLTSVVREIAAMGFTQSYTDYPLPDRNHSACFVATALDPELSRDLASLTHQGIYLYRTVNTDSSLPEFRGTGMFLLPQWRKRGFVSPQSLPRGIHLLDWDLSRL